MAQSFTPFNGGSAEDRFGYSVSGAGDVNGDGYDDVIVGARKDDNNGGDSGSARVISGEDGSILYTFNGDSANDYFGRSVSGAGDVNGDGYADVIVGSGFVDGGPGGEPPTAGKAYVFVDECPSDANKGLSGACGCGIADTDSDGDGTADCLDLCSADPNKTSPGSCGCGVADTDSDGDGTADCNDSCSADPLKTEAGQCGCGVADTDSDSDGTADCNDVCSADPNKIVIGQCGCGFPDVDLNSDGLLDCFEDPNATPPIPDVPEKPEEVVSLADDAKDLVRAMKGKKKSKEAVAALKENLDAISQVIASAVENGVLADEKSRRLVRRLGRKMDRLQVGRPGGPSWRNKKQAFFRTLQRLNRALAQFPDVPETPEEVVSLADDAKDLVRAMKGKKKSKEAVAALKENLDAISQVIASAVENGVLADEKSRRLVRRLGRKMDRLQVGRPGGPSWRNKKQAFFRTLQRLNRALAQ